MILLDHATPELIEETWTVADWLSHYGYFLGLAYAGALVNTLWKLANLQKKKANFSFKVWWKLNKISTYAYFVSVPLAIIIVDQMDQLNELVSIATGWGADVMLKDRFSKKTSGDSEAEDSLPPTPTA